MKVAVLGAGISGVTTAYYLARMGHEVTVVDRQPEAAAETSFANGGVIGGTQIEPWAQPGVPLQFLGWIGREDAPVLVRWRQLPHVVGWGIRFLLRCTSTAYHESVANHLRLTLHSLSCFAALRAEGGVDAKDYGLNRRGALKLYFSEDSFAEAREEADTLRSLGLVIEAIDRAAAVIHEPGLSPRQGLIRGALLFPNEEIGDCRRFALALERTCRGLGVRFQYRTTIRALVRRGEVVVAAVTDSEEIRADAYVAALASYTPLLLRGVGLHLPIIPTRGVTISVPAAPWPDAVRGAVMDHSRLFGLIRIGDDLRVSGSAEVTGHDTTVVRARCNAILANVLELFPEFARCLEDAEPTYWAGLRGNTPDGAPILGKTLLTNLFLNCGHGPQGWSTSAGSAQLVAQIVSGVPPSIDLAGLTMERF